MSGVRERRTAAAEAAVDSPASIGYNETPYPRRSGIHRSGNREGGSQMPYAPSDRTIEEGYRKAQEIYALWGVDTEAALRVLAETPVSIHCWQGDDVAGLEVHEGDVGSGGIQATGNYPGRARTGDELRSDISKALDCIPGKRHRVNIHAFYAETDGVVVDRNALEVEHFSRWIDWARSRDLMLDFNPTYFAHPLAADGYTLASPREEVRRFWIEHGIVCRRIAAALGEKLGGVCVNNLWIPDGEKDTPVDRWGPRRRLKESLDEILAAEVSGETLEDTLESKLFGIGSESYVVGSHEFYLSYCVGNRVTPCVDMGHFHPTENVADKISSILLFCDKLLIHVSRGIRWDSDHVVILNDDVRAVCEEVVRGGVLDRVFFALDFFDASINRIAAWVIGTRSFQKALLSALLQPVDLLRELESGGDGAGRLGVFEEAKTLPMGAVWDYFCLKEGAPVQGAWLEEVRAYEKEILSKRGKG